MPVRVHRFVSPLIDETISTMQRRRSQALDPIIQTQQRNVSNLARSPLPEMLRGPRQAPFDLINPQLTTLSVNPLGPQRPTASEQPQPDVRDLAEAFQPRDLLGPFRPGELERIGQQRATQFRQDLPRGRERQVVSLRDALQAEGVSPETFQGILLALEQRQPGQRFAIDAFRFPEDQRAAYNRVIARIAAEGGDLTKIRPEFAGQDIPVAPEGRPPETVLRQIQQEARAEGFEPEVEGQPFILTSPLLPPEAGEAIEERLGPAGGPVRRSLEFATTPALMAPVTRFAGVPLTLAGEAGAVTAGTGASALGAPPEAQLAAEIGGGLATPGTFLAGPRALRAAGRRLPTAERGAARIAEQAQRGVAPVRAAEPEAVVRGVPEPELAPPQRGTEVAPAPPQRGMPEAPQPPLATRVAAGERVPPEFVVESVSRETSQVSERTAQRNALPPIGGAQEFQPSDVLAGFEPRPGRPRRPPTQRQLLNQNLNSTYSRRVRVPAEPQLRPDERDIIGEALERFSGIPERVVPVVPDNRLPELQQFLDQSARTKQVVTEARSRVTEVRRAVRDGIAPPETLRQAEADLSAARAARQEAEQALRGAEIRVSIDDIANRARQAGAPDTEVAILREAYEDSLRLIPSTEPLLTASGLRQRLARFFAMIEGTPPGRIGAIANQRDIFESAVRNQTAEQIERIGRQVNEALERELDSLRFVGPERLPPIKGERQAITNVRELAEGEWKDLVAVQHPGWFRGWSKDTLKLLGEAQKFQRSKLELARAMGYPIEALNGPYLEQLWDVPRSVLETPIPRVPGKVSIAREREFGDYVEGLAQGFTPKDLTVGELIEHSSSLMDQAIGDAFQRRLILERFGTKGRIRRPDMREFNHPLYRGWSGRSEIVNFVDQLHNPPMQMFRNPAVRSLAAATKGTVFGVLDIGVFGTHMLDAITTGGPVAVGALINRGLRTLNLPHAHIWMNNNLDTIVRHQLDGVSQGLGPSAIQLRGGTLLKYVPVVGQRLDRPVSAAIDELARIQYGAILRPMRNLRHEGNLLVMHLTGSDITDPAVRRISSDWANSSTGASRGAMTRGRRAAEQVSLTSFQMTRAELARIGQIAKALGPQATREERLMAAMTLASWGSLVYGLGSAINAAFGEGPFEFNPAKGDWASLKVGGQTIPLISRRSIIRAVGKSYETLADADPQELGRIWSQVVVAKMNPATSPIQSALGFGFEPSAGFQAGTLSPEGRILNMAPLPPLAETLITEPRFARQLTDLEPSAVTRAGLEFGGSGVFPQSVFERRDVRRDEVAQRLFGRDYDDLNDLQKPQVDRDPALAGIQKEISQVEPFSREGEGFQAIDELRAEQRQQQLRDDLALDENTISLAAWKQRHSDREREFFTRRETIQDVFGITFEDEPQESERVNRAINNYFAVELEQFLTDEGEQDFDAFRRAQEQALAPLTPQERRKFERFILSKHDTEKEREFRRAQALAREYEEIVPILDRWQGEPMPKAQYERLATFWDQADLVLKVMRFEREKQRTPQELAREAGVSVSTAQQLINAPVDLELQPATVREWLADQQGWTGDMRLWALNGKGRQNEPGIANPARDRFLEQHRDALEAWFPALYEVGFERRQAGVP